VIKYPQSFFADAGHWACYALSILHLAELVTGREHDPLACLEEGVKRGWIKYAAPGDTNNFFVLAPDKFLSWMAGRPFSVRVEPAGYVPAPGEYAVDYWEYSGAGHFVCADGWNPLAASVCVAKGKVTSRRVFAPAGVK
jgi:hypothetical protein